MRARDGSGGSGLLRIDLGRGLPVWTPTCADPTFTSYVPPYGGLFTPVRTSMKYLLLVYGEEDLMRTVPDAECMECGEKLDQDGKRIAAEALQPVNTAATVRVRQGAVSVTDGPFAETKEQLAGFYLVDADDLDDAIRMAGTLPPARIGSIEVRPIRELQP
jgi:hypothetical protein